MESLTKLFASFNFKTILENEGTRIVDQIRDCVMLYGEKSQTSIAVNAEASLQYFLDTALGYLTCAKCISLKQFSLHCDILSNILDLCDAFPIQKGFWQQQVFIALSSIAYEISPNVRINAVSCLQHKESVWRRTLSFWISETDRLVRRDFLRFERLEKMKVLLPESLFPSFISRSIVKLLICTTRIQSVIRSMQLLGMKKEFQECYQVEIRKRYFIEGFDIVSNVDFNLHLLADRLVSSMIESVAEYVRSEGCYPSWQEEVEIGMSDDNSPSLILSFGNEDLVYSIGYSPLCEVLFIPSYLTLYRSTRKRRAEAPAKISTGLPATAASMVTCFCGQEIKPWRCLGVPSEKEIDLVHRLISDNILQESSFNYSALPSQNVLLSQSVSVSICERCYRSAVTRAELSVTCCPYYTKAPGSLSKSDIRSIANSFSSNQLQEFERQLIGLLLENSDSSALPSTPIRSMKPAVLSPSPVSDGGVAVAELLDRLAVSEGESSANYAVDRRPPAEIAALPARDFQQFLKSLWRGTSIIVVFNANTEKSRLLYMKSSDSLDNDAIDNIFRGKSQETFSEYIRRSSKRPSLYLGWARRQEVGNIALDLTKSHPIADIKSLQVGSQRFHNCIRISLSSSSSLSESSSSKSFVIKIEDETKFQIVLRGLTQLVELLK